MFFCYVYLSIKNVSTGLFNKWMTWDKAKQVVFYKMLLNTKLNRYGCKRIRHVPTNSEAFFILESCSFDETSMKFKVYQSGNSMVRIPQNQT